ncbi:uncharacterized protein LY79DRAFT_564882 [Colletotrichum navitas]|uniref:Uncharacterized protein n=1 Tax=Colletotrichum navitas TaxID=681940 RepID=A0AAD8PR14_9PEZI|nr:uncharacterized protein LY79DRAFT_564882 [Colletotrichum navitas]KAK1579139.1 hypothetical protein LY79DRAFT_564882 [Colletotrichum navitas]
MTRPGLPPLVFVPIPSALPQWSIPAEINRSRMRSSLGRRTMRQVDPRGKAGWIQEGVSTVVQGKRSHRVDQAPSVLSRDLAGHSRFPVTIVRAVVRQRH